MKASRESAIACGLALIAFAANSLLCRAALAGDRIDPTSFTAVRVLAGAIALVAIGAYRRGRLVRRPARFWSSGLFLFGYAAAISYAYRTLEAGTGSLILFAAVQATMIGGGLVRGEALRPRAVLGWAVALGGLVILLRPGWLAPDPRGLVYMSVAGFAWGAYSLRASGATDPLAETAENFLRASPLVLLLVVARVAEVELSGAGVALAVASGALASGGGYVLWYVAIRERTATSAAMLQLSVPVIAAAGGIAFLGEPVSLRLLVSSALVLGGIALGLVGPGGSSERKFATQRSWISSTRSAHVTTSARSSGSCESAFSRIRRPSTSSSPIPTIGESG